MATTKETFFPIPLTIGKLFDDFYQIPRYQRPYKWTDEHVEKLWEDLTEAFDNTVESYFLGSVITIKPDNSTYLEVVDGQQRLTTLMILFAVVRDLFNNLNKNSTNPDPSDVTIQTIKDAISKEDKYKRLTLHTHLKHQNDFNEVINSNLKEINKPQKKDIYGEEPIFKFKNTASIFKEKLTEKSEEYVGKFINYLFNKVHLIRIDCSDKDFAIKLFQILNNRGLDLSNSDLIKSYLIQKIEKYYEKDKELKERHENLFMQEWNSIEEIIKDIGHSLNDVFIIYEYFLLASNPKKSLYDELEIAFRDRDSIEIINDFKKFVLNFKKIWEDDDVDIFALKYLRWNYYWKSILIAAYHKEYKDIAKLKKLIKKYYYLNWIAGKNLNTIKQMSFNLIGYVKNHNPIDKIEKELQDKMNENNIIGSAIIALKDNNIYSDPWCKPLFCMLEYNATDKADWIGLNKDLHLEHIIPIKYKNFEEWGHITEEIFNKWGNTGANLTLLGGTKNREANEKPFIDKMKVYKGKGLYENKNAKITGFSITQKIVNDFESKKFNKEWNENAIQDRWNWFCEEVAEILDIDVNKLKN